MVRSYEEWRVKHEEQQAKHEVACRGAVERAQSWVGCFVWCVSGLSPSSPPVYGEVTGVDEYGVVHILIGRSLFGQPYYWQFDAAVLGKLVTLAE